MALCIALVGFLNDFVETVEIKLIGGYTNFTA